MVHVREVTRTFLMIFLVRVEDILVRIASTNALPAELVGCETEFTCAVQPSGHLAGRLRDFGVDRLHIVRLVFVSLTRNSHLVN